MTIISGVLEEIKVGREKLFINSRLMRLLTAEEPGDLSFPASAQTVKQRNTRGARQ